MPSTLLPWDSLLPGPRTWNLLPDTPCGRRPLSFKISLHSDLSEAEGRHSIEDRGLDCHPAHLIPLPGSGSALTTFWRSLYVLVYYAVVFIIEGS